MRADEIQKILDRRARSNPGESRIVLGERIGGGAFGVVYRLRGDAEKALKVINVRRTYENVSGCKEEYTYEEYENKTRRELEFCESVRQWQADRIPDELHIMPFYGTFTESYGDGDDREDVYFILMRYIPHKLTELPAGFDEETAVGIGIDICKALVQLREIGGDVPLVHRDLKPGNIFFRDDANGPFFLLGDFGTIRRAVTGESDTYFMTDVYTRPEEIRMVDARRDIYSLGMILYWYCCGCKRLQAQTDLCRDFVRPGRGSDELAEIIRRATCDWMHRYPAAQTMLDDLTKLREKEREAKKAQEAELERLRGEGARIAGLEKELAETKAALEAEKNGGAERVEEVRRSLTEEMRSAARRAAELTAQKNGSAKRAAALEKELAEAKAALEAEKAALKSAKSNVSEREFSAQMKEGALQAAYDALRERYIEMEADRERLRAAAGEDRAAAPEKQLAQTKTALEAEKAANGSPDYVFPGPTPRVSDTTAHLRDKVVGEIVDLTSKKIAVLSAADWNGETYVRARSATWDGSIGKQDVYYRVTHDETRGKYVYHELRWADGELAAKLAQLPKESRDLLKSSARMRVDLFFCDVMGGVYILSAVAALFVAYCGGRWIGSPASIGGWPVWLGRAVVICYGFLVLFPHFTMCQAGELKQPGTWIGICAIIPLAVLLAGASLWTAVARQNVIRGAVLLASVLGWGLKFWMIVASSDYSAGKQKSLRFWFGMAAALLGCAAVGLALGMGSRAAASTASFFKAFLSVFAKG